MTNTERPDRPAPSIAFRTVWIAILALVAVSAVGLQLDRQARRDADLARAVPKPFRHFAQPHVVRRAIASRDVQRAFAEARKLVISRPVPAENLSLLARAAAIGGKQEQARKLFLLAAGRGWRDALAQAYVVEGAIEAGEWSLAADRAMALWILGRRDDLVAQEFRRISRDRDGRKTIAGWLRGHRILRRDYALWGVRMLDPDAHVQTLLLSHSEGAGVTCETLGLVAEQYLVRGTPDAARRAWSGRCAASGSVTLDDASFRAKATEAGASPFGWNAEGAAGFPAQGRSARARATLAYESDRPGYRRIAWRLTALQPGTYPVLITHERDAARVSPAPRLELVCIAEDGSTRPLAASWATGEEQAFAVPDIGCPVQRLDLLAPRGRGTVSNVEFSREQP